MNRKVIQMFDALLCKKVRFVTRDTPGIKLEDVHGIASHYSCDFEPTAGGEVYKLDVGAELNCLLDIAYAMATSDRALAPLPVFDYDRTVRFIKATYSIAARVAEFEELDTIQQLQHAKELSARCNETIKNPDQEPRPGGQASSQERLDG